MINYFFVCIFIIALGYGMLSGRVNEILDSLMSLPYEACIMIFKIGCSLLFFQGIIEIAKNTFIVKYIRKLFDFVLSKVFRSKNDKLMEYVSLNLTCNLLGMGQVATSCGLKAMEIMVEEENGKDIISFLALNVSGFCLIPQTIMSLRQSYGAKGYDIVFPSVIITFISFLFTIFLIKVINHD